MRSIDLSPDYMPDEDIKIKRTAIAIGKFDGVHMGHRTLLSRLKAFKDKGYLTVVFTFDGSIAQFFTGEKALFLSTGKEQEDLLSELGIDILARYPVNSESVSIDPSDFVKKYLVDKLHAGAVVAGYDCSFGARGLGDIELLMKMGREYDFETVKIDRICEEGSDIEISSTYVRNEVLKGDMEHVKQLLGSPYSISGKVLHGRKLGRAVLSMPTVNLCPDEEKILPPFGVYFSKVYVASAQYFGVTNIGRKPTVNDTDAISIETYIYDFDDDLYGENIKVELLHHKRGEFKFNGVDELKAQMHRDLQDGKVYFSIS